MSATSFVENNESLHDRKEHDSFDDINPNTFTASEKNIEQIQISTQYLDIEL